MSLGIRNIRAISQSRGSKEGNDAFAKVGSGGLSICLAIESMGSIPTTTYKICKNMVLAVP